MAGIQDGYLKITVENVGTSAGGVIDPATLITADNDIKSLIRAVQSSSNKDSFVGTSEKRIDPNNSKLAFDLFVKKDEYATNVEPTLRRAIGNLGSDAKYTISNVSDAELLKGTIQLHGKTAQSKAREEIEKAGGYIVSRPTKTRPDNYDWYAPADLGADKEVIRNSIFKEAQGLSKQEQNRRTDIKKEKDTEKKEEQRKKEEVRKKQESKAEQKGVLLRLVSLLTLAVDITRRILTSVMEGASQAVKDTRDAGNYGLSYADARAFRMSEKALGLKEGTNMGALSDIQSKFGNIYALDDKALQNLAIVMGGEIKDLVETGIGGKDPESLMETILNKYFSVANAGYNSLGQYVGQDKARREMVEQLKKVSPQLAELLSVMLENAQNPNSLYYGRFSDYGGLLGLTNANVLGIQPYQEGVYTLFGNYVNKLNTTLSSLKEGIKITIAERFLDLLERIANLKIFLTPDQRVENNRLFTEENKKSVSYLESNVDAINRKDSAFVSGSRKKGMDLINEDVTLEDIVRVATRGELDENRLGVLGIKDTKGFYSQAKELYKILKIDPNIAEDIISVLGSLSLIDKLNEQITNHSNGKDVDLIKVSPDRVTSIGTDILRMSIKGDMALRPFNELSEEEKNIVREAYKSLDDSERNYINDKMEEKNKNLKNMLDSSVKEEERIREFFKYYPSNLIGGVGAPVTDSAKLMNYIKTFIDAKIDEALYNESEEARNNLPPPVSMNTESLNGKVTIEVIGDGKDNVRVSTSGSVIQTSSNTASLEYAGNIYS